ncbi:MAG: sigma-70 family RNA polymerase sigma factor [Bacteroidota bacterium]
MSDRRRFVQVIQENEGIIFKVANIYAREGEDQKDLYQEIVYQLWRSFKSFQGKSKISTWIYRVALNTAIRHMNQLRKKASYVSMNSDLMDLYEEQDAETEERMTMLYEQIKQLNVVERGIILLHLEGKSYQEIGSITGFTPSNVGTRLSRIRNKLSAQIKNMNHGSG